MIVLLLFNKTNMFLQNILNELKDDQVWYAWVSTLVELEKNDLDTKEWRMKFIIDVLKLSNSFGYKFFRDGNQLADLLQVKQDFATAKSYHANKTVVWGKLKNIIESISYEIRKENEWTFDFAMIKQIVKWEKDIDDLLFTTKEKTIYDTLWSFKWLSGTQYSGKWSQEMYALDTDKILDILKWYNTGTDRVKLWIEVLLNPEEKDFIKKHFKQLRLAWLSILKEIVDEKEESLLINEVLKRNVEPTVETNETTQEDSIETNKAPF